jgi:hypothetical protein
MEITIAGIERDRLKEKELSASKVIEQLVARRIRARRNHILKQLPNALLMRLLRECGFL